MHARAVLLGLLDLLAPLRCPGCDEAVVREEDDPPALDPLTDAFCVVCAPLIEPFDGAEALYAYGGPLAEAIKRFKYEARLDTLPGLARLMGSALPHVAGDVDLVVPVPLFPARRRARGFNQSALLAQPLAKALGLPLRHRLLARVRDTPPQAQLDAAARARNVEAAFRARPLQGERVLLIDDVHTTGATLEAAQEALFEAGASAVIALCLAGRS
jgi:ComF family protein